MRPSESGDPFTVLGLAPDCTPDDVAEARRRLSKRWHPDLGGDAAGMQRINAAADLALRRLAAPADGARRVERDAPQPARPPQSPPRHPDHSVRVDDPSFTIEALPVEAFEALLVVATELGEVIDDDPPYLLEVALIDPVRGWCRLGLVPDAGATTVGIAVAAEPGRPAGEAPSVETVRDLWIAGLNALDWAEFSSNPDGSRPPS